MKKHLMALLLAGVFLLISACGAADSEPISTSATVGDFKVTFTSARNSYNRRNLDPEAPLSFETRIEYLGDEEAVTVSHDTRFSLVELYAAGADEPLMNVFWSLLLLRSELYPGEPVVELETGAPEYRMPGLPAGDYVARAYVEFTVELDDGGEQPMEFCLELPFTIK